MVSRIGTYEAVDNNNLCVNLIVRTYGYDEMKKQNEMLVKNAFYNLEKILQEKKLSGRLRNNLLDNVDKLINSMDISKIKGSIGMFASASYSEIIYFDGILPDKLVLSDSFQIKNTLLSELNHLQYYLINMSENYVKLYEGNGLDITEVKNDFLPFHIEDKSEHEHKKNLLSKGSKKTDVQPERLTAELNIIENKLRKIVRDKNIPVIVCGKDKMLSSFKILCDSHWTNSYYFVLSFENTPANEIGKFGSRIAQQLYESNVENILCALENKTDSSMLITDIKDIWHAANEGKSEKLFLDKTFSIPVKMDRATGEIFVDDLDKLDERYETIPNIIELIIEKVILNKGKVYFLSENKLDKYGKTVMSLRYTGKQHPIN